MKYSVMDDKIFEFVYVAAMRDATLQRSFAGKKSWMRDCKKFSHSTKDLKTFVSDVIKGKFVDSDSFNKRFLSVSQKVCHDINSYPNKEGAGYFTSGNAQKLINILMKYFYLHSYGNKNEKANFRFCHCPIDQQLLETVWKNRSKLTEETRKSLGKGEDFLSSWGNEDFFENDDKKCFPKRYEVFQKAVKELAKDKSSLEFDYCEWGNTGIDS